MQHLGLERVVFGEHEIGEIEEACRRVSRTVNAQEALEEARSKSYLHERAAGEEDY